MFQFPGFASYPLWIQGYDTCFHRLMTARALNNRQSGGFPHSETHGSKPIPGSPWLIAGYHVLHRLLLPRHPPNALLALDPTRKENGLPVIRSRMTDDRRSAPPGGMQYLPMRRPRPWFVGRPRGQCTRLGTTSPPGSPRNRATLGAASDADVSLSQRCQSVQSRRTR
jgi:hypothetical protein